MRIMLVCAGGMSTGILMNKMKKHAHENQIDLEVEAYGVGNYQKHEQDFDVVLLGPQISYKADEIKASISLPVDLIKPMDYAMGNAAEIIKQANALIK